MTGSTNRLLPKLSQLLVYDNSAPAKAGPRLLLRRVGGVITGPADLAQTPAWAKPIVAAALKLQQDRRQAP